jgi:hypothetical protein
MRAQICFFVSIVFSFVAWGVVAGSLILPELRRRGRNEALRPLLMFHSFRFVSLAFLVPGVVSPDLPAAFAEGAAYGDIVAAALALLTLALLPSRLGIVAVSRATTRAAPRYRQVSLLPYNVRSRTTDPHRLGLIGAESCSATTRTMRDVCARLELSITVAFSEGF